MRDLIFGFETQYVHKKRNTFFPARLAMRAARHMPKVKYKSKMKTYYKKAGIKVARHCLVRSPKVIEKFIAEVGFPVIVKPDNGVGAAATYKIRNADERVCLPASLTSSKGVLR